MKKILNKNTIFVFIIGAIISSIITAAATTVLCSTDEVLFTPENSNFNATNATQALNILYDYYKIIDDMSTSQVVTGTINLTTSVQTVPTGFKPSKIVLYNPTAKNSRVLTYVYDSNINSDNLVISHFSSSASGSRYAPITDFGLTFTNTSFSIKANADVNTGTTYYYAIK